MPSSLMFVSNSNISLGENNVIKCMAGTTAGQLKNSIITVGDILVADGNQGLLVHDDYELKDGDYAVMFSGDGIAVYYTIKRTYIPGDIYEAVSVKQIEIDGNLASILVTVNAPQDLNDAYLAAYFEKNGVIISDVYFHNLMVSAGERKDIVFDGIELNGDYSEAAAKVVYLDKASKYAETLPMPESFNILSGYGEPSKITGASEPFSQLMLWVVKPNKVFEYPSIVNGKSDAILQNMYAVADADGKYTFDGILTAESGDYGFILQASDGVYSAVKFIANKKDMEDFANTLADEVSEPGDLFKILDAERSKPTVGLNFDNYNKLSDENKWNVCANIIDVLNLTEHSKVTMDDFAMALEQQSLLLTLVNNDGKFIYDTLDTSLAIFGLSGSTRAAYEKMTETEQVEVCGFIAKQGRNIKNTADFRSVFDISVVNCKLSKYITHKSVYTVLMTHSDIFSEIDYDRYMQLGSAESKVNAAVLNNLPFSSVTALTECVNKNIKNVNSNSVSSSGGGGGGSPKRNSDSASLIAVVESEPASQPPLTGVNMFSDLESYGWCKEAVNILSSNGIVSGRGDGIFDPAAEITREEFLKLVLNACGVEIEAAEAVFDDVDKNAWYANYIYTAYKNGIVKGISENEFGIGQPITRQDMMVMSMYLLKEIKPCTSVIGFRDIDQIDEYAYSAVATFTELGIVNGSDSLIMPKSYSTRAEAAKLIYESLKYLKKF